MDRTIRYDINGNDITCMKVFDALENPCDACNIEDCPGSHGKVDKVWKFKCRLQCRILS